MANGTLKLFYAGTIDRVNPGAGADGILFRFGYLGQEGGIDMPGDTDYPDVEDRVPSISAALANASSGVRFMQNAVNKKDSRGWVYGAVFGTEATTPVAELVSRGPFTFGKIDMPERSLRLNINRANTDVSGDEDGEGDQLPQDV